MSDPSDYEFVLSLTEKEAIDILQVVNLCIRLMKNEDAEGHNWRFHGDRVAHWQEKLRNVLPEDEW